MPNRAYRVAMSGLLLALAGVRPAEAQSASPTVLQLGPCEGLEADSLREALAVRIGVDAVPPATTVPSTLPIWRLDAFVEAGEVRLLLTAPDGRTWERSVERGSTADAAGVRALALAAEYLLALAEAPFGRAVDVEPEPFPLVPPDQSVPVVPAAEGTPGPSGPLAASDADRVEPDDSSLQLRFATDVFVGTSGDLSRVTRGEASSFVLGLRPGLEIPPGVWIHVDVGWHFAWATFEEPLQLHVLPVRLGLGVVIGVADWRIRLAFQGVMDFWWTAGSNPQSGWRGGGGFLASGTRRLLPWLALGVDLGVELLPDAYELLYGETPVFSLGPWRWRALVWASFIYQARVQGNGTPEGIQSGEE